MSSQRAGEMVHFMVEDPAGGIPGAGERFDGPLFIVGMPRSGTKLLRTLVNRHSQVGLPEYESHFIPFYARSGLNWERLRDPQRFHRFHRRIARSNFGRGLGAELPSAERWRGAVREWSCAGVMEALFRLFAQARGKRIWGDKTPLYLRELPLLSTLYPGARFVHIVRDVRDYCLSARAAWGKHPLRAAQRWHDDVAACRRAGAELGPARYLELRYEDLLTDPERLMRRLSAFLGLPYEPATTVPDKDAENLGAARGARRIVSGNTAKWRSAMSAREIARIEAICAPVLRDCGYPLGHHRGPARRVSRLRLGALRAGDALRMARHVLGAEARFTDALRSLRGKFIYRTR
ncbi:sulfotransferase family protein [Alkalilimnicola sp. S0819]|uniref:sulfotransferase family protein n=1 Tax=Alkalilimnicola sp. S0819 TaxID=2613922 RepID=UPI001262976A|nr:sulfotransferase [Alkalilimnicola sp. S0819]KAB7627881.1 sulfotransferase [Alkalilimnicola sp. S0819]MPQ15517.1 hypothetical protein [Alkalilimnicola sp. S0819]